MDYLWEIIIVGLGLFDVIFSALFIEHFTKFRPGLAEKFLLKKDFLHEMETKKQEVDRLDTNIQLIRSEGREDHAENREDHGKIYDELRKMNEGFNKQFVNMIKEVNGQFDKMNDKFLSITKCLNKLNDEKSGNA